jgi:hypothetical protein
MPAPQEEQAAMTKLVPKGSALNGGFLQEDGWLGVWMGHFGWM